MESKDDKENFDGNEQMPPYKDLLDVVIIMLVVFLMLIELLTKLDNSKDIEANNYNASFSLFIASLPFILKFTRTFPYCMGEYSLTQVKKLLPKLLSANISSLLNDSHPCSGIRIQNPRYRLGLDSLVGTAMTTFELQYNEESEQLLEDGDEPEKKKKKKSEEELCLMEPSSSSESQSSEAEELQDAASVEEPMLVEENPRERTATWTNDREEDPDDSQLESSCESLPTGRSDLPLTSDDPASKTRHETGTSEEIEGRTESIGIDFPSISGSESSFGEAADEQKGPTQEEAADEQKGPTPEEVADQQKGPTPEEVADQRKEPTPEEAADQRKEPTPEEIAEQRKKTTEETIDQSKKTLSPEGKQKKSKMRISPKKLGQALTSATVRLVKKTASSYRQLRSLESRRSSPKAGTSTGKRLSSDSETELAGEENLAMEGGSSDGESITASAAPESLVEIGGEGSAIKHERPSKKDRSQKTKSLVPSQPGPSGTKPTQPVVRIEPPTPVVPRRGTQSRESSISSTLSPPQVVTRQSQSDSESPETKSMGKNRQSHKDK